MNLCPGHPNNCWVFFSGPKCPICGTPLATSPDRAERRKLQLLEQEIDNEIQWAARLAQAHSVPNKS